MEKDEREEVKKELEQGLKEMWEALKDAGFSLGGLERWIEDRIVKAMQIYSRGGR